MLEETFEKVLQEYVRDVYGKMLRKYKEDALANAD
jgi:hypothetical protein